MAEVDDDSKMKNMIFSNLNIENAKVVAFILAVGFVVHSVAYFENTGDDSCKRLLTAGEYRGNNEWQSSGCMMHKYNSKDALKCFQYVQYWGEDNYIVFVGDSRLRELYFRFVNHLSEKPIESYKAHSDVHYHDDKSSTKVDFLWNPILNTSFVDVFHKLVEKPVDEHPTLIIAAGATWNIKYLGPTPETLKWYQENVTRLVPYFKKLQDSIKILWMIQDPIDETMLKESRKMITNEEVDKYNRAAIETLYDSTATLWSSSRLVAKGAPEGSWDGLHNSNRTLDTDVNILLNMYCNNRMNYIDGTCCSDPEPVTFLQQIVATIMSLLLFIWILSAIWQRPKKQKSAALDVEGQSHTAGNETWNNFYSVIRAMGRLAIIMGYFYLCDRTNLFLKENKHYTLINFLLPFLLFLVLGLIFTKDTDQTAVLHRDQTDEWKGWMQIIILIYHYSGASKVIPIYMQIRCLVTSYLFLTGFGHFTFFFKKGDFSPFRLCQVMFRMNFLVITLCFVMNRPYQFYYFVPLVSFFFLGIYVTMAVWPHVTEASTSGNSLYYVFLVMKLILLLLVTYLLNSSFVFFEKIFLSPPLKPLFSRDGSVKEWFFRWSIDRFSIIYGMIFAFVLLMGKKYKLLIESDGKLLFSPRAATFAGTAAALGITGYTLYTSMCTSKPPCNRFHAYVSFVPIVSFIVLRNLPGWLRKRYSVLFAWFGKISLELFIGQYHTWLAADTQGLLVLVPGNPLLNLIVTSFIFVCLAHEIHLITGTLANFAVPKEGKYLARNCVIFTLILIPVAIDKGVFRMS